MSKIDFLNIKFPKAALGFSPTQVRRFLSQTADYVAGLHNQIATLSKQLEETKGSLDGRVKQLEQERAELESSLMGLSKLSDQAKEMAQKESQFIIEDAKKRAALIIQNAEESLSQMYRQIADLKRARAEFECQVKACAESHLMLIERLKKDWNEPEYQSFDQDDANTTLV